METMSVSQFKSTCLSVLEQVKKQKIGHEKSLSPAAKKLMAAPAAGTKWISAISCWELAKLVEKKRTGFPIPVLHWIRRSLQERTIRVADLSPEIAVESTQLPEFHPDPADQLIVATSRVLGMPLAKSSAAFR